MWPFSHAAPATPRKPDDQISHRDILADDRAAKARTRWTRLLIVYLRGLSLLCLVRGMMDWSRILGYLGPENGFEEAALIDQVALAVYAVLNSVAAVGLWLTSAWGAVLWLMVTLCEVFLPWSIAGSLRDASAGDATLLGLAVAYVGLTWLSARERDRDRSHR